MPRQHWRLLICLYVIFHTSAARNEDENDLYLTKAPWHGLAWPRALDETLACSGTSFCYKKGEENKYDCNSDRDCLQDGAGTWCREDCGWSSDAFFELGGADCCAYDPGFTDSSRHDQLPPANAGAVASCQRSFTTSGSCGQMCASLEKTACGVVTEDGYVKCFPDFHPAEGSEIYFPTIDMGESAWFPDPDEVFFKLRPVVSFGMQGLPGCNEGISEPSVEIRVDTYVVMAYVTERQHGCRQKDAEYLAWLNKAVNVAETKQWGWTGQWRDVETSESGGNDYRFGCAIEKTVTKFSRAVEGQQENVVLTCQDLFSSDTCGALHMNDGSVYDTEVEDFNLRLAWNLRKSSSGTEMLADLSVKMCIEQSRGSCSDSWSSSVLAFENLALPLEGDCAPAPPEGQEQENLCGLLIQGGAARGAPSLLFAALGVLGIALLV